MTLARVAEVRDLLGLRFGADTPVVMVAGTNGKGSTCAMLESIALQAGYRVGLVSAAALRIRVTRLAFAGRDAAGVEAAARRYAEEDLPALVRPAMLERLAWHRDRGDTVVLVPGSLDSYLRPWCGRHGLELLCNRLEAVDGRLTGRYLGGDRGRHKASDIRARYDLSRYARIHAYGDSREDRPMLALAHERWYRGRQLP